MSGEWRLAPLDSRPRPATMSTRAADGPAGDLEEIPMIRTLIVLALLATLAATEARAERYYSRTVVRGYTSAADDAAEMARTGRFGHRGTCNCREGIGCGSTPEQALANCCYYGRYTIREKAVARGANGRWYAVIRYAN